MEPLVFKGSQVLLEYRESLVFMGSQGQTVTLVILVHQVEMVGRETMVSQDCQVHQE